MKVRAKKSLGQNFLRDETVVERTVGALELTPGDTVVEIGPGTGALTRNLVGRADHLIAVEFDRDLIPGLAREFGNSPNIELINADALKVDLARLGDGKFKIVGNLPYNVATPILQRLAGQRNQIAAMVLMFQREVAERLSAPAGGKERGYLSVVAQNAFDVERLFDVPPTAFWPVPKVWSSVIRLLPKDISPNEQTLLDLVSAGFSHKRKTLFNNLKPFYEDAAAVIRTSGIDPSRRAETLTVDEWKAILASAKKAGALRSAPAEVKNHIN